MDKNNIVITSHSLDEAITDFINRNKNLYKNKITIILLENLIKDYEIFDELSDSANVIRWYDKEGRIISNKSHTLLNRVLYYPSDIYSSYNDNDKDYAQREFESYLGFAFNSFYGVGNKDSRGICVKIISLPMQWREVRQNFNIKTPKYYWGPTELNILNESDLLITSDIHNFINWSPGNNTTKKDNIFCFHKPVGQPVFTLTIGSKQMITTDIVISNPLKMKICRLSAKINLYFNYFISEILFFVDGNNLTFACINPQVIKSKYSQVFDTFMGDNLISEFQKCIN